MPSKIDNVPMLIFFCAFCGLSGALSIIMKKPLHMFKYSTDKNAGLNHLSEFLFLITFTPWLRALEKRTVAGLEP